MFFPEALETRKSTEENKLARVKLKNRKSSYDETRGNSISGGWKKLQIFDVRLFLKHSDNILLHHFRALMSANLCEFYLPLLLL